MVFFSIEWDNHLQSDGYQKEIRMGPLTPWSQYVLTWAAPICHYRHIELCKKNSMKIQSIRDMKSFSNFSESTFPNAIFQKWIVQIDTPAKTKHNKTDIRIVFVFIDIILAIFNVRSYRSNTWKLNYWRLNHYGWNKASE